MPTFSIPRMLALAAGLGLAFALGTRRAPAANAPAVQSSDPLTLTGHDWSRLSPDERNAYLIGFIAGAAAQQATAPTAPGTAPASGRDVARRAVALKRSGSLTFPYRENVYRSHLDDYFFYQNRRTEALIQVLVDMHATARSGR